MEYFGFLPKRAFAELNLQPEADQPLAENLGG
jgi:hypothetical protein